MAAATTITAEPCQNHDNQWQFESTAPSPPGHAFPWLIVALVLAAIAGTIVGIVKLVGAGHNKR